MSKHSIILRREGMEGFQSIQSIGTDALNAMSSIPGVKNPEIINESEELVVISYDWVGEGKFLKTDEHLLKFGLARSDVKPA